jgi:hypothetical protein
LLGDGSRPGKGDRRQAKDDQESDRAGRDRRKPTHESSFSLISAGSSFGRNGNLPS